MSRNHSTTWIWYLHKHSLCLSSKRRRIYWWFIMWLIIWNHWRLFLSYRKQASNLECNFIDWFLYDGNIELVWLRGHPLMTYAKKVDPQAEAAPSSFWLVDIRICFLGFFLHPRFILLSSASCSFCVSSILRYIANGVLAIVSMLWKTFTASSVFGFGMHTPFSDTLFTPSQVIAVWGLNWISSFIEAQTKEIKTRVCIYHFLCMDVHTA